MRKKKSGCFNCKDEPKIIFPLAGMGGDAVLYMLSNAHWANVKHFDTV